MKIKKFKARNFAEALEMVRKELSEDAVILSSEEKKGPKKPFVEVTAAVDYDSDVQEHAQTESACVHAGAAAGGITSEGLRRFREEIKNEVKSEIEGLRMAIEGMKRGGFEFSMPKQKRLMFNYLRERRIKEEFAMRLCEKAGDFNDLPSLITRDVKTKSGEGEKIVMLTGPTGVGKTTTIAKLSARAMREGRKVGIINLDTYRIGAVEQVRIYSRIMGIPLAVASTPGQLRTHLANFSKSRDLIFIDTTGRNPRDESYIEDMRQMCDTGFPMELHLLISAGADDEAMTEAYRSYSRLPVDYIAFTKLDEAVKFGPLYNIQMVYQKPVAYVTTGQQVPDDMEFATADMLGDLILSKGCYKKC
ncbi:MAG: flagellar biosynthesis protein FlhF [Nitrospiraceae bacterium]|nr:flagellar biosynthesis protein FlhF [Nitrospiraceae bacterium]